MGFLKKLGKGLKKIVKGAAKGIKKMAKKVVTSLPGGEKLWKKGGELLTKVASKVGKVMNKLGPIGMIGLSILAPYAAPLWASFGAAAAAGSGILSSVGSAIFTAGNWIGGTISAMTSGISEAVGTIVDGGFKGLANGSLSKAGEIATKSFADVFTGRAGAEGVRTGLEMAADFALKEAAGQGLFDQTVNKIMGDVGGSTLGEETVKGSLNDVNATIEQNMIDLNPNISDAAKMEQAFSATQAGVNQATDFSVDALTDSVTAKVAPQSMETMAGNIIGNETSRSLAVANTSLLDKAGSVAKSLLSGTSDMGSSYMPVQSVGAGTLQRGNVSARGGVGSGGGNFLSESMLRAVQQQQQRMARGFG